MAKPREATKIEILYNAGFVGGAMLHIWCEDASKVIGEITRIEGFVSVSSLFDGKLIRAAIDPRYDAEELAQEVRDLLAADVPEVFRE